MPLVTDEVEREIWPPSLPFRPSLYSVGFAMDRGSDRLLCRKKIGVSGCGCDAFASETCPQLIVGFANMPGDGVAATRFVFGETAPKR